MSYTITKNDFSIDVMRDSDGMACGFMCSNVFNELDTLYHDAVVIDGVTIREADTLPEGKNFGDVKTTGRGWVQEDYNWDTELNNVFGEVDATVKTELENYFTSDMKAKYLEYEKSSQ